MPDLPPAFGPVIELALRGSRTSEPVHAGLIETTGVGGDAGRAAALAANSSGVRYLSELCGRYCQETVLFEASEAHFWASEFSTIPQH
jgi:hypothetical protein